MENSSEVDSPPEAPESIETFRSLNASILMAFVFLFILRRSCISTTPTINIIKGRMRSFGAWLLSLSLGFALVFSVCITALSKDHDISRSAVELSKMFDGSHYASIKGYAVDVVVIMLFSLKISEILLVSAIYILVALWVPQEDCGGDEADGCSTARMLQSSIGAATTMWAIFRIPLCLYTDAYRFLFDDKITVFVFEIFAALEYLVAAFLLLILNSRHSAMHTARSLENMGLLSSVLLLYGVFKHAVNLVNLPFSPSSMHLSALSSVQLALQLGIYVLMCCLFCPLRKAVKGSRRIDIMKSSLGTPESLQEVVLVPSMIEFDERLHRNQ